MAAISSAAAAAAAAAAAVTFVAKAQEISRVKTPLSALNIADFPREFGSLHIGSDDGRQRFNEKQ